MKGGLNLSEIDQLRELLHQKADIQARIKLIPYDGAPEIKTQGDKQYLYVRKRIGGRNTSTYVDLYSETLYQLLLKNARERRELEKTLRQIDRKLLQLGYTEEDLDPQVQKNLDFARINMKSNIYDQAILEGVATSFPQTEEIIDNGIVNGMMIKTLSKAKVIITCYVTLQSRSMKVFLLTEDVSGVFRLQLEGVLMFHHCLLRWT